jgi:hypothetical protein
VSRRSPVGVEPRLRAQAEQPDLQQVVRHAQPERTEAAAVVVAVDHGWQQDQSGIAHDGQVGVRGSKVRDRAGRDDAWPFDDHPRVMLHRRVGGRQRQPA